MIPWHLGALHPAEQVATIVLAFGPFLLLGVVVWWRRRAERDETDDQPDCQVAEPGDVERRR